MSERVKKGKGACREAALTAEEIEKTQEDGRVRDARLGEKDPIYDTVGAAVRYCGTALQYKCGGEFGHRGCLDAGNAVGSGWSQLSANSSPEPGMTRENREFDKFSTTTHDGDDPGLLQHSVFCLARGKNRCSGCVAA